MDSPRNVETGPRLVSRASRIDDVAVRAVLADAFRGSDDSTGSRFPRTVWDAPGEPTVVATGVAAELTAAADRFGSIRRAAETLFSGCEVDTPDAARPRLFGGFSFHAPTGTGTADGLGEDADSDSVTAAETTTDTATDTATDTNTNPLSDSPPDEGKTANVWAGFPGARFLLPRVQVTITAADTWLTVNAVGPEATPEAVERRLDTERERLQSLPAPDDDASPPGIATREHTVPREQWCAGVEATIDRIEAGELSKVVLAQALRARLRRPLSLPTVLAHLGETYPDCHRFLLESSPAARPESTDGSASDRGSFFGATPERLVHLRGRTLQTDALAGTTGRGETQAEDEWLAEERLDSPKNVHEHELVVDAIREQLEPFAASFSAGERRIRRLATVQHLWTPITANLDRDEHVLSLVEALHPTPAVGGLPPEQALATIRKTEPFDRGWYAAPVGWFDAAGDGSFAVAIRSAVTRGRSATLFAGVGIVADSDPESEWKEAQLKYRPILDELERE